jgi:hypothetical protein
VPLLRPFRRLVLAGVLAVAVAIFRERKLNENERLLNQGEGD